MSRKIIVVFVVVGILIIIALTGIQIIKRIRLQMQWQKKIKKMLEDSTIQEDSPFQDLLIKGQMFFRPHKIDVAAGAAEFKRIKSVKSKKG